MKKDKVENHIIEYLNSGETLTGFFFAQKMYNFWLYMLVGIFAMFSIKQMYVALTNKGVHFFFVNLLGGFANHDFFSFSEIETVSFGKGFMQRPVEFRFSNGRKLKIKAQLKGAKTIAKITDEIQAEFMKNINVN